MELRREAERSKEEKNEVDLVGRFDSNQFVYEILECCFHINPRVTLIANTVIVARSNTRY